MAHETMRSRFVNVASSLLDEDPRVVLVTADIGLSQFREQDVVARHRERLINVGIREQLMIGVASGLALEGMRPIVHTYAPFLVERPYEQLKLDFTHQGVGGVFVSVGASYDSSASGRTHQAPEDVALISTLPGWTVHVPGHPDEVDALLRRSIVDAGNVYLRLAEDSNSEAVHSTGGRFVPMRTSGAGSPLVIAVGPMLDRTLEAVQEIDATVMYATTVVPFDREAVRSTTATEVVLVEPYLEGTSSGEVAEALVDIPHRQLSIGVPKAEHRRYGTPSEHAAKHGLTVEGIAERIRRFLAVPAKS